MDYLEYNLYLVSVGIVLGVCAMGIVALIKIRLLVSVINARRNQPTYARTYYEACALLNAWHGSDAERDKHASALRRAMQVEGNGTSAINVQSLIDETQAQRRLLLHVRAYLLLGKSGKLTPFTDSQLIGMIERHLGETDDE